jgi:protein MpaA
MGFRTRACLAAITFVALATWAAGGASAQPASAGMRGRLAPLLDTAAIAGGGHASARLGRTAEGTPIRVENWGASAWGLDPPPSVLVVGCIHGDECAGQAVIPRIVVCPPYASIWAIPNLNPDGHREGTRLNGRGVDLNRNFPHSWRPIDSRYDPEYSGPHPFSEPETRLVAHLIRIVHPKITIWFHQEAEPMVRAWGQSVPAAKRYAKLSGIPFRHLHWLRGTAPNWQNHHFPGTSSFVVELPPGPLTGRRALRLGSATFRLTKLALPARLRHG